MNRVTAKARLSLMVASSSNPVLSDADMNTLTDLARRQDAAGRWPSDAAYDGDDATYDLNAAAAQGWGWKAGKVAGDFNFSADGASYSKADVLAHCQEREAFYGGKVRGSMQTGAHSGTYFADELIP